jgi:hypothetical protein
MEVEPATGPKLHSEATEHFEPPNPKEHWVETLLFFFNILNEIFILLISLILSKSKILSKLVALTCCRFC